MIKVEHIETWGFEHAIRGMRNPMNSWDKSDSEWRIFMPEYPNLSEANYVIGKNDLDLMKRLYKASLSGDNHAHRKYLRQISVSMDITAPLYYWKEFDTYKVGITANSCSTMHKIASKEFELDDFSHEHLFGSFEPIQKINSDNPNYYEVMFSNESIKIKSDTMMMCLIELLNFYREKYLETKDKKYWWQMIQLLPSSYNQKRTVTMNYENAITIIKQRTNHKLDEWNDFVEVLHGLPYIDEIMGEEHPKHVQPDTLTKVNYSKDGLEEDLETIRKAGVRCCGTCQYYRIWNGVCVNGSSDYVADFVSLDFECEHWEEMKNA